MKILAISGSLQEQSSNSALVRAAGQMTPDEMELIVHSSLGITRFRTSTRRSTVTRRTPHRQSPSCGRSSRPPTVS
jgi:hypothetical protein